MSNHGNQFGSQPPPEGEDHPGGPGNSNDETIPSGENYGTDEDDSGDETPIGEDEPRVIATEVLDEIEEAIGSFKDGDITKGVATFHIIQSIDGAHTTPETRRIALDYYVDTLDRIQSQIDERNKRGKGAARGLGRDRDERPERSKQSDIRSRWSCSSPGPSRRTRTEKSKFSGGSHDHDQFPGHRSDFDRSDSEGGESGDGLRRGKLRKLDVKRLPWYEKENLAREIGNPSTIRTRELLEYFGRDYAEVKRQIELSGTAPVGFPSDQWDNVVRYKAVNLDVVLSSLYHVGAPKENVGRIGRTEISLGRSEPIRKVETYGQWTSAFNAYVKAVRFAFEHREQELRDYMEYIEGLFSSRVTSAHSKVILFDKAVREEVGGGQRILLTDTHCFQRLATAILMPDGIEVENGRRKGKQPAERGICIRFNRKNCPDAANDCRWRHVCRKCGSGGHPKPDCPTNL